MRREATIFPVLFVAALLSPFAAVADEAQDLKAAIVVRCIYSSGEFGNQLVDICVRDDLAAAQALRKYPAAIVDHCAARMQDDGWARVKICADEDIAAEEALAKLDPKHAPAIADCRTSAGASGSAAVKSCVDAALTTN